MYANELPTLALVLENLSKAWDGSRAWGFQAGLCTEWDSLLGWTDGTDSNRGLEFWA